MTKTKLNTALPPGMEAGAADLEQLVALAEKNKADEDYIRFQLESWRMRIWLPENRKNWSGGRYAEPCRRNKGTVPCRSGDELR